MMRTLVVQHVACEPPGEYENVLLERGSGRPAGDRGQEPGAGA